MFYNNTIHAYHVLYLIIITLYTEFIKLSDQNKFLKKIFYRFKIECIFTYIFVESINRCELKLQWRFVQKYILYAGRYLWFVLCFFKRSWNPPILPQRLCPPPPSRKMHLKCAWKTEKKGGGAARRSLLRKLIRF